nr:PREDICTED: linker for activation of T-cells family member 1 [Latimeria chalumnae]|eukprot:XP_014349847.1 PREDICTED: linker for activation of T-cells family member 1 [Latimeria chalumnae]
MDVASFMSIMWACFLLLPVVIVTTLCLGCWERKNRTIRNQESDYEDKPPFFIAPHPQNSSFAVLRQPNYKPHSIPSIPPVTSMDFLPVPSPLPVESRRSSYTKIEADNESGPSYENEQIDTDPDDDDYKNYGSGYITILPDDPAPKLKETVKVSNHCSKISLNNSAEDYENLQEVAIESDADTDEFDGSNYVNVAEMKYGGGGGSDRDSEDDGPDYVNAGGAH